MLHGFLVGSLASWYYCAAPVLARTYRVLLYDLGGHGRSEHPASGYALANPVADLEALRPRLPVFLARKSFGGLLALAFAAAHPSSVAGMVLIDRIAHAFRRRLGRHSLRKRTRLARTLPAAELRLLPGCTHSVLWEATSEARRQVEQWLAGRVLPAATAGPAGGGPAR